MHRLAPLLAVGPHVLHEVRGVLLDLLLLVGDFLFLLVGQLQRGFHAVLGERVEAGGLHDQLVEALGLVGVEDGGKGLLHVGVHRLGQLAHLVAVLAGPGRGEVVLVLVGDFGDLFLLVVGQLQFRLHLVLARVRRRSARASCREPAAGRTRGKQPGRPGRRSADWHRRFALSDSSRWVAKMVASRGLNPERRPPFRASANFFRGTRKKDGRGTRPESPARPRRRVRWASVAAAGPGHARRRFGVLGGVDHPPPRRRRRGVEFAAVDGPVVGVDLEHVPRGFGAVGLLEPEPPRQHRVLEQHDLRPLEIHLVGGVPRRDFHVDVIAADLGQFEVVAFLGLFLFHAEEERQQVVVGHLAGPGLGKLVGDDLLLAGQELVEEGAGADEFLGELLFALRRHFEQGEVLGARAVASLEIFGDAGEMVLHLRDGVFFGALERGAERLDLLHRLLPARQVVVEGVGRPGGGRRGGQGNGRPLGGERRRGH